MQRIRKLTFMIIKTTISQMSVLTVYHATTSERAERCLAEGLIPFKTTEASPSTLALDQELDKLRPRSIVRLGLQRATSVYAHIGLNNAITRSNGGWLTRYEEALSILAIAIEARDAFVAEGQFIPYKRARAQTFWASVMTLEDYMRIYSEGVEPTYTAPTPSIRSGMKPEYWSRYLYMWPEVLIPNGVEASQLSVVPWDTVEEIRRLPPWER